MQRTVVTLVVQMKVLFYQSLRAPSRASTAKNDRQLYGVSVHSSAIQIPCSVAEL